MKTTTTQKYVLSAFIFALLQTFAPLHLDGLTVFFTGMAILSYMKDKE